MADVPATFPPECTDDGRSAPAQHSQDVISYSNMYRVAPQPTRTSSQKSRACACFITRRVPHGGAAGVPETHRAVPVVFPPHGLTAFVGGRWWGAP